MAKAGDAERQVNMTIQEDMDELALCVEYQHILADHSKPLPLPFEQWKAQRPFPQNPETHKDMGEDI